MNEEVRRTIQQILSDPDYFHKAKLINHLLKHRLISLKDLSRELNMKSSYVCHVMRLNKLPEIVIDGYYSKLITLSHLFVLSRLKDEESMAAIYEKVLHDSLTVLQTDYLVRKALHNVTTEGDRLTEDEVNIFMSELSTLGSDVSVRVVQTRIKARIQIEIKGNLSKTTEALRKVISKLAGGNH